MRLLVRRVARAARRSRDRAPPARRGLRAAAPVTRWFVNRSPQHVRRGRDRRRRAAAGSTVMRKNSFVPHSGIQQRRAGRERGERIDDDRQRLVVDLDQLERVLGDRPTRRDDRRDRLADEAHPVAREHTPLERLHARAAGAGASSARAPAASRSAWVTPRSRPAARRPRSTSIVADLGVRGRAAQDRDDDTDRARRGRRDSGRGRSPAARPPGARRARRSSRAPRVGSATSSTAATMPA